MLILAGVVLNLTLGEHGIFKTAEQAAKNYTNAQNKETADLNYIDSNVENIINGLEIHNEDEEELEIKSHLVDHWKLENSLENVKADRQNLKIFKGENLTFEGKSVHIEDTVLSTSNEYLFPKNFTITYDYKKTSITGCTVIVGKLRNIRATNNRNGLIYWMPKNHFSIHNGSSCKEPMELGKMDEFINLAYTFDGTDYCIYRNGELVEKMEGYQDLNYELLIGGTYASGKNDAGFYWGYANGYFKDIRVYDKALIGGEIKKVNYIY